MNSRSLVIMLLAVSATVLWLPTVHAALIITGRHSEVWYNSVNLTDGIHPNPPSTNSITSSSLIDLFNESIVKSFNWFTVTGAHNTAELAVSQNTWFSTSEVFSDVVQSGSTTTDTDHPAIYTKSIFVLDFAVSAPTDVTLTGLIEGSSIVGNADFARVILSSNAGPIFNTGFGHAFPFQYTLLPTFNNYQLRVEATGYSASNASNHNDSTYSRAQAHLTAVPEAVPEPSTFVLGIIGTLAIACGSDRARLKLFRR